MAKFYPKNITVFPYQDFANFYASARADPDYRKHETMKLTMGIESRLPSFPSILNMQSEAYLSGGLLFEGDYTPVKDLGGGKFYVEGYRASDAMVGAEKHCGTKDVVVTDKVHHPKKVRGKVTFQCK